MNTDNNRKEWQEQIEALAGMEQFKALMTEWMSVFPVLEKTNNFNLFMNRVYLFSIADGEGFSKQLKLMAKAVAFSGMNGPVMAEREVNMPYIEATERSKKNATPASLAIESLRDQGMLSDGVPTLLGIDIREWIGRTGSSHFRLVLEYIFEHLSGPFVFRVPLMDEKYLRQIEEDIADVRNVSTVVTHETTIESYLQYADILAKRNGAVIAEDAKEALAKCLVEEKNQGNLNGYATVKKIFNEILYLKILQMGKEYV